jgi:hypothetical protein
MEVEILFGLPQRSEGNLRWSAAQLQKDCSVQQESAPNNHLQK